MAKRAVEVVGLGSVEMKALASAVSAAKATDASTLIPVGTHPFSFNVQVSGVLVKGEDYDTHEVQKAKPWVLLALALSKLNGVTVDFLVREAEGQDMAAMADATKLTADAAVAAMKAPTLSKQNGKVQVEMSVVKV